MLSSLHSTEQVRYDMKRNYISSNLTKFTSALAFFPFVSPHPLNTDLQPVFFIFATLALSGTRKILNLTPLLIFAPMMMLSLGYFSDYSQWDPADFVRLFFCTIAFTFFLNFPNSINEKFLFLVSAGHFSMLAFHYMAPSTFIGIFEPFLRVIKISHIGIRGASGLAPEPGFAGAISVAMLALASFRKDFHDEKRFYPYIFALTVLGVFLTRSGTGSLYLVVFIASYFLKPRQFLFLFLALSLSYLAVMNLDFGRGADSIRALLHSPAATLSHDVSIGSRVLNILIGFFGTLDHPVGFGFGDYDTSANLIAEKYGLSAYAIGNAGQISGFATYSIFAGFIWWLTLAAAVIPPLMKRGISTAPYLLLSTLFISTSFSIAFPLSWALIALCWSSSTDRRFFSKRSINPHNLEGC